MDTLADVMKPTNQHYSHHHHTQSSQSSHAQFTEAHLCIPHRNSSVLCKTELSWIDPSPQSSSSLVLKTWYWRREDSHRNINHPNINIPRGLSLLIPAFTITCRNIASFFHPHHNPHTPFPVCVTGNDLHIQVQLQPPNHTSMAPWFQGETENTAYNVFVSLFLSVWMGPRSPLEVQQKWDNGSLCALWLSAAQCDQSINSWRRVSS